MDDRRIANAAYVQAMAACAIVEGMGMLTENLARIQKGEALTHDKAAFSDLLLRYGIDHNSVVTILNS